MHKSIRQAPSCRRIATAHPKTKGNRLIERLQSLNASEKKRESRSVDEWTSNPVRHPEQLKLDGRARLSGFWSPTAGTSRGLLERAGFVKRTYSGVFHLLPLGLRVQQKIEGLIDKHMSSLGASKLSLSAISSTRRWQKSGRYDQLRSELFELQDRKDAGLILSPTHEEEITYLVAEAVHSYKTLPLRLYQISRKYRDELRPRKELLRTREFLMKDLYTFDQSNDSALASYKEAQHAYIDFFRDLEIPFEIAQASSGSIGGSVSHEFHFPSASGEDSLCKCDNCTYCANEEIAEKRKAASSQTPSEEKLPKFVAFTSISYDRLSLFVAFTPKHPSKESNSAPDSINLNTLKTAFSNLDPSVENPITLWKRKRAELVEAGIKPGQSAFSRIINVYDGQLVGQLPPRVKKLDQEVLPKRLQPLYEDKITVDDVTHDSNGDPFDLTRVQEGDPCPRCDKGRLQIQKAIEVGHTFLLGTRYSEPLRARFALPGPSDGSQVTQISGPVHMGCYGIGISRLISAIAEINSDELGLNWPRRIAPFEVIIVPAEGLEADAERVYDAITKASAGSRVNDTDNDPGRNELDLDQPIDVVIDDRDKSLIRRLVDAEWSGCPVRVIIGKEWRLGEKLEVQCRKLGKARDLVELERLPSYLSRLLALL